MDRKLHAMSRQCNAAFVMVLLSGCTTLIPPYTTPNNSTLPAHYQQGSGKRFEDAALTSAADKTWQSYFPDPHLQALIRQALLHNHDLRSAALRVRQAQAAYRIERSSLTPTVALGVDAQRSRTPADLTEIGQTSTGNEFKAGVGISSWEIDFWGRITSLNEEALQQFLATQAGHRAVTISLVAQVADAWIGLRELDERLRLANAAQANQSESLRIFTHRFEMGSVTKLELTQVQTLLTQAEALALQLQQQRDLQRNAVNLLVGQVDLVDANYSPVADQTLVQPWMPACHPTC